MHGFLSECGFASSSGPAPQLPQPGLATSSSSSPLPLKMRLPLKQRRLTEVPLSQQWAQTSRTKATASIVNLGPLPDSPDSSCTCNTSRVQSIPLDDVANAAHGGVLRSVMHIQTGAGKPSYGAISGPRSVEQPPWLGEALAGWSNPTFAPYRSALPAPPAIPIPSEIDNAPIQQLQQITKDMLSQLTFLEQIDGKFLLCRLAVADGRDSLILVDQHAADERVRVERMLKTYCAQVVTGAVEVMPLAEARPILLDAHTARFVFAHTAEFEQWGLHLRPGEVDAQVGQCHVLAVPAVVASRLQNDLKLVKRLVMEHCSKLAAAATGAKVSGTWTSVIRQAPALLADLMNSRACRGESGRRL